MLLLAWRYRASRSFSYVREQTVDCCGGSVHTLRHWQGFVVLHHTADRQNAPPSTCTTGINIFVSLFNHTFKCKSAPTCILERPGRCVGVLGHIRACIGHGVQTKNWVRELYHIMRVCAFNIQKRTCITIVHLYICTFVHLYICSVSWIRTSIFDSFSFVLPASIGSIGLCSTATTLTRVVSSLVSVPRPCAASFGLKKIYIVLLSLQTNESMRT